MGSKESGFKLERKSTLGEGVVEIAEMATKDLEYYMNFVVQAAAGFQRLGCSFKSSTVSKMLSSSVTCHREITGERNGQSMQQTSLSYFKRLPQPPNSRWVLSLSFHLP